MFELLFLLLLGHAFADFVFQTDAMAKGKNRHNKTTPPPGAVYQPSWYYWLTSHAFIHGGMVYFITGMFFLGLAELVCHWIIDFFKCENKYGIHVDQALHLTCKIIWLLVCVITVIP